MKPYRYPAERQAIERAPEELRQDLVEFALKATQSDHLSPVLTNYQKNCFGIYISSNEFLNHQGVCFRLDSILNYPQDDLFPPEVKREFEMTKAEMENLIAHNKDYHVFRTHRLSYIHGKQEYFCTGSLMRYIEDNYYSFRHYLDTGEMPTAERMAEERRFQARKLLVELIVFLKRFISEDQLEADADHFICEIEVPKAAQRIEFRGHTVIHNGHAEVLLKMTELTSRIILSGDPEFLSAETRAKLERSKKELTEALYLRREHPEFDFWDVKHEGTPSDYKHYLTGLMPILDWFLAYEKELKAEYADRESTFERPKEKTGIIQSLRGRLSIRNQPIN